MHACMDVGLYVCIRVCVHACMRAYSCKQVGRQVGRVSFGQVICKRTSLYAHVVGL